MVAQILRLEFAKQRHVMFSLATIFLTTLVLTLLRQLVARQHIQEGFAGILLLLSIAGIPLLAALLGGSAGAGLRSTTTKAIEDSLPFHPRRLFFSSYLISLFNFVFFSLLILGSAFLAGAISGIDAFLDMRWREFVLILFLLQLHALAFSLSYVFRLTVVGALAALAVCGLQISLFTTAQTDYWPYWLGYDAKTIFFYSVAGLAPFCFAGGIGVSSKNLQRDALPSLPSIMLLSGLLIAASLALTGLNFYHHYRLEKELNPSYLRSRFYGLEKHILRTGSIFETSSGRMFRVSSTGEKTMFALDNEKLEIDKLLERGEAAYSSPDRRTLIRKLPDGATQEWQLPGTAVDDIYLDRKNFFPTSRVNEEKAFLLIVRDSQSKLRIVLCTSDGSIKEPWTVRLNPSTTLRIQNIPGEGTMVAAFPERILYVMDSFGHAIPPIPVARLFSKEPQDFFYRIYRLRGNDLWVMINGREFGLVNLEKGSGKILAKLGKHAWPSIDSAEEGIYFKERGKIHLLEWNGNTRAVTSAYID